MSDPSTLKTTRRLAMQGLLGATALPILGRTLATPALAQGYTGVAPEHADRMVITGDSVPSIPFAEWDIEDDASRRGARTLIVQGKEGVDKAPANASRYEAKLYQFSSGAMRVLRWKRGTPIVHQITFATEIFVLEGSATLQPLYGIKGTDVKIGAGDGLYFPSGTIRNPKPTQDFVIVEFLVASATPNPKSGIIREKDAEPRWTAQWEQDGKPMSVNTEAEFKKAPKHAVRYTSKRYIWEGNSMRVTTWAKGGKSNVVTNGRTDAIFYVIKGHLRRTENNQVFDLKAGDVIKEFKGYSGFWEPLEPSAYLATDIPLVVAGASPTMVAR